MAVACIFSFDDWWFRSQPILGRKFEFRKDLLQDYKGRLQVGELAVDTLSVEAMKTRCTEYEHKMTECQQFINSKRQELAQAQQNSASLGSVRTMCIVVCQTVSCVQYPCTCTRCV